MTPRPALLFTLCYGAGLATGLLHFGGPLGVIVLLGAGMAARRSGALLLATGALLGRSSGELARIADRDRCAARLEAGRVRLTVRLWEPVTAQGGRVQVEPVAAGCAGAVDARWPSGVPVAAGYHSRVEGRWIPRAGPGGRPGGVLVVAGAGPAEGSPSIGARLRTMLGHASRTLYGVPCPAFLTTSVEKLFEVLDLELFGV